MRAQVLCAIGTVIVLAAPAHGQVEVFAFQHAAWSESVPAVRDDGPDAEVRPLRDLRFGFAVAYSLTDHVQLEGLWLRQTYEARTGRAAETRVEGLHLEADFWVADVIYAFDERDVHGLGVRPYLVLGAGVVRIEDANGTASAPVALGGGGLKLLLTPSLGLRLDARVLPFKVTEAQPTRAAGRSTNAGYNSSNESRKAQMLVTLGVTLTF